MTSGDSNNKGWGEDTMNVMEVKAMLRAVGNPTDEIGRAAVENCVFGGKIFWVRHSKMQLLVKFTQIAAESVKGQGKVQAAVKYLGPEVVSRILAAQGIETSAASILARRDGVIPNSNLELLFSAPMLRQFSFRCIR